MLQMCNYTPHARTFSLDTPPGDCEIKACPIRWLHQQIPLHPQLKVVLEAMGSQLRKNKLFFAGPEALMLDSALIRGAGHLMLCKKASYDKPFFHNDRTEQMAKSGTRCFRYPFTACISVCAVSWSLLDYLAGASLGLAYVECGGVFRAFFITAKCQPQCLTSPGPQHDTMFLCKHFSSPGPCNGNKWLKFS